MPLPPYLPYPKFLLELPLSETARLVYCLILSRILLSQHNGWLDKAGRVYCRYPVLALAADCRKSKSSVTAALRDLEDQGLLLRRRGGAGYANMLSLRLPENWPSDDRKTGPQTTGKPAPNYNTNKITNYKNKKPYYDFSGDSL